MIHYPPTIPWLLSQISKYQEKFPHKKVTDSFSGPELDFFGEEVKPIVIWLVDHNVLFPGDLFWIKEDVKNSDDHIMDIAYDCLSFLR